MQPAPPSKFKYRAYCTHKAYLRRKDPQGKFTFDTNDIETWKARCAITGVRIDRIETREVTQS